MCGYLTPMRIAAEEAWAPRRGPQEDTTSGMQCAPAILFTQQVLGVDRVLDAMDYPYQFVPEEVKVTDELPIGEEDRSKLYHLNAQRVFKL
jgi:5-carboxyvanillate decarboxylase